jgi:hypothetical protein
MTQHPEPVDERCIQGVALALLITALSIGIVKHMLSRGGTGAHATHIAAETRTP